MKYALLFVLAASLVAVAADDVCTTKPKFELRLVEGAAEPVADYGHAVLYVVTEQTASFHLGVAVDNAWRGATKANTHFAILVAPGIHELCATGGIGRNRLHPGYLTLHAEAGKFYYVAAEVPSERVKHARLELLDPAQGAALVDRTRTSELVRPSPGR